MPKNFKWLSCLLAAVVTVTVLFGGQSLWTKYAVANPLDRFFSSIEGVGSVQVNDVSGQLTIDVTMNDVKDLPKTYESLQRGIKERVVNKKYILLLHDNRNSELQDFYTSIHFYIQEAIATGRFSSMAEQIKDKAAAQQIQASVWVDAKNVYLQLEKNGAQMYEIVPRPAAEVK